MSATYQLITTFFSKHSSLIRKREAKFAKCTCSSLYARSSEKNMNCTESLMMVYLRLPYLQLANKLNDQPNQLLRCTAARQRSNPVIEEYKLKCFFEIFARGSEAIRTHKLLLTNDRFHNKIANTSCPLICECLEGRTRKKGNPLLLICKAAASVILDY